MPERKRKPPTDAEAVRRVEQARPGARATDPTFDAIIEAILDTNPDAIRERKVVRRERIKRKKA